jgi:DNA-binding NarL/FixJ family response regulator
MAPWQLISSRSWQFTLPPDRAGEKFAPAESGTPAEDASGSGGVLIVEDDFLIALQAESALTAAGFHVIGVAATAEEAVALAKEHKPSIAIMDIRLAGQRDGIDAAGELFRDLGLRCVFASAHDDQSTRARAEPFVPLGWLAKPYTMGSLVSVIRDAISKSG